MTTNTKPNTPRRIINLDLVDVAHMNLLDHFDKDKWDSIERTTAAEFIDLIGEKILSVSESHQRDPQDILQAAENAVAMIRAAFTGEEVSKKQGQRVPSPQHRGFKPTETAADIIARIRSDTRPLSPTSTNHDIMTIDTLNTNTIELPARTTDLISRAQRAHDQSHWKGHGDLDTTTNSLIEIIAREVACQSQRDHCPEYDIADAAARAVTAIKIAITEGYTREDIDSPDIMMATNQIKRMRILRAQAMERHCPLCGVGPDAPCEENDRPIEAIHAERLFPEQFGVNFLFETLPGYSRAATHGTYLQ